MAMIKKKGMGKPMKKAQKGGIISESGDLADALNEYEAMKKKGTVPKTSAAANKYMDNLAKQGKLGPAKPSVSKVVAKPKPKPKAKNGFDLNKDGKTTFKDVLIGRGVLPKTAKKGAKIKKK